MVIEFERIYSIAQKQQKGNTLQEKSRNLKIAALFLYNVIQDIKTRRKGCNIFGGYLPCGGL